jgi:gamma-glutamyl-gamma-aminobutyrate hydrolase PuuD
MALIAVTASTEAEAEPYVASLVARQGTTRILTPAGWDNAASMQGVSGLLLCGGDDIEPSYYGAERDPRAGGSHPERDEMEMAVLRHALDQGMPVLGICRGMQVINVAFGGSLLQDFAGHCNAEPGAESPSIRHEVYVSPGSKLGAIMGGGAIYKTNSLHHQGLMEAQRAPGLRASAYHPVDGVIEGLESPDHRWLIGVQCHPERESEVAKGFLRLFGWLVGWSERYEGGER